MTSAATTPESDEPTHGASPATDNPHGHGDNVHGTRPRRRGRALEVVGTHSIDSNRACATGQSMGAMMTMALNIEYPHLFAGSLIVAGQWTTSVEAPPAKENITYIVSGGDAKAKPGMTDFEAVPKQQGVTPAKAMWDGRWTQDEYTQAAADLYAQNRSVNLITFAPRTVTPAGACIGMAALEHIYTWDHACQIDALRTWLLAQHKPTA